MRLASRAERYFGEDATGDATTGDADGAAAAGIAVSGALGVPVPVPAWCDLPLVVLFIAGSGFFAKFAIVFNNSPKRLVLFELLFFLERQFHAESQVGKRVLVQDALAVEHTVANFEIDAQISVPQPVKRLAITVENTDAGRAVELFRRKPADGFNQRHLLRDAEFVHLRHALVAEVHLIHGYALLCLQRGRYRWHR